MITTTGARSRTPYTGKPGATNDLQTAKGLLYNVRAPDTYTSSRAWPLIVLYPGAGEDRNSFEEQCEITASALAAGYIIAYTDHVDPTHPVGVGEEGSVPAEISARWRIKRRAVYLGGNSDGATGLSENLIDNTDHPAAVVLNAVGTSATMLSGQQHPPALSVMVIHGALDKIFPIANGYGIEVADWWAVGAGSQPPPAAADAQGFQRYPLGDKGRQVMYNQPNLEHGVWPTDLNAAILAFFS